MKDKAPGAALERVPMLRGRITAINGAKAETLKPGEGSAQPGAAVPGSGEKSSSTTRSVRVRAVPRCCIRDTTSWPT